MNALEFFSPEAGQRRRQWLESKLGGAENALRYYFGPTGVPDKLEGLARALEFTDAGDMVEAGRASQNLWNSPSLESAVDYATAAGALAIPFVGARMMNEGTDILGSAVDDFMTGYDPNRVNIFAGVNAKTADLGAYEQARQMAEGGASRKEIWDATGWFQGVDGKWRFEIDDMRSRITPLAERAGAWTSSDGAKVGEVIDHEALFAAYPELAGYNSAGSIHPLNPAFGSGSYSPKDRAISVTAPDSDRARSVMLHELQHGVQDIEGFASGGNPTMAREIASDDLWGAAFRAQDNLDNAVRNLPPEYQRQWEMYQSLGGDRRWEMQDRMMKNEVLAPILDLEWETQRLNEIAQEGVSADTAFDTYQRLAGEVEARNVETRRDVTPLRRGEPWSTQGVADQNQIVRFRPGQEQASVSDPAATRGQEVLDLLSAGRASEVTDDMLDMGDPVLNARLNEYLWKNYDLPMDEASRMARAQEMGFDTGTPLYHGTRSPQDIQSFKPSMRTGELGTYFAKDPDFANEFANYKRQWSGFDEVDGTMYPAFTQQADDDLTEIGAWVDERNVSEFADTLGVPQGDAAALLEASSGFTGDAFTFNMLEDPLIADQVRGRTIDFIDSHNGGEEWNRVVGDPAQIRSRFARFDPRLSHLRNLSAGIGALTLADILAKYGLQQDGPSSEAEIEAYLGGI